MSNKPAIDHAGPPKAASKLIKISEDRALLVRGKLKKALDLIVWQGKSWQNAAIESGLTTQAVRKALAKQHVQLYLKQQRQVFRASVSGQNIHRAVEIRDQDENRTAAIQAIKYLDGIADHEQNGAARAVTPGVQVIVNMQRDARQIDNLDVIEVNTLGEQQPVRNDE